MNCGFCFLLAAELYVKVATSDAVVVLQAVANSCQAESCTASAGCGINSQMFHRQGVCCLLDTLVNETSDLL